MEDKENITLDEDAGGEVLTDEEAEELTDEEELIDEESEEDSEEEHEDEEGDIEIADDEDKDEEQPEQIPPQKSTEESAARDEEKEALRHELDKLKMLSKEAIKALGMDTDDVVDGLAHLAAETKGVTKADVIKEIDDKRRIKEMEQANKRAAYEQMKASDLAAIHAEYPETKKYKSVEEFPNFKRFGELRDGGASPGEAFIASHSKQVQSFASGVGRQKALNESKNHLRSVVPKASEDKSVKMSPGELETYREMFPDKSDKEILSLYRRAKT